MKRLLQKPKFCQWTMFLAVMCVGTVSGMMIVGEEDPDSPMTMGEFFLLKAAAFIAIYLCYRLGNLKTPEFYQEEDFKVVIWRADNEGSVPMRFNDDPKVFQSVPTDEEKLLEVIKVTPSISRAELSKRLKISERQVRKITDQLRKKGVLIREGGNSGKWVVNNI